MTGYDVSIDSDLYTEADFTFSGNATVSGTDAGAYDMELKPEDFENTNPNFGTVTFVIVDGQLIINMVYFNITVNYLYDNGDPIDTISETHEYGYEYSFTSPTVEGYTPDTDLVEGRLTSDTEIDVIYSANGYTLTIYYLYEDGRTAARTYTANLAYGTDYSVVSPTIAGYHASIYRVTGTMPAGDVTVYVYYTAENEPAMGVGPAGINVGESIE